MKLVLILLFIPFLFQAQKDENLVSRSRPGLFWFFNGNRPIQDADYRKYDRCIIDATYNTWIGDLNAFEKDMAKYTFLVLAQPFVCRYPVIKESFSTRIKVQTFLLS